MANKSMASAIALFLLLTITATLITLPTVDAVVNYYTSPVYVAASPPVIGVNQHMLIIAWTAEIPPDIGEQTGLVPGGRQAWYDITINVTKPDGTTETLIIAKSDPVGGGYVDYVPTQIGTYTIQAFYKDTWKNTTANQYYYSFPPSEKATFTVQEEPIPPYPESPLPNDYFTRPLYGANRYWYVIAGNWLAGAAQVWPLGGSGGTTSSFAYGIAPESAHILWTTPFQQGGLMDTRTEAWQFYTGLSYQGFASIQMIVTGKIYKSYQDIIGSTQGYECIDLYTGERLYYVNATTPSMGQIYNYESPNQHGGMAYLWRTSGVTLPEVVQVPRVRQYSNMSVIRIAASTAINRTATPYAINQTGTLWEMIDAYSGQTMCYIANVSATGTSVYGKDGSILYYNTVNLGNTTHPNYYLTIWNSSAGTMVSSQTGTGAWQWRPAGGTFGGANPYLGSIARNYLHDGSVFWTLNVSIPSLLGPRNALLNETATIRAVRQDEYVIFGTAGRNDERGVVPAWFFAISLKPGLAGTRLWETTFTPPRASFATNTTVSITGVYPEDGVIMYESARMLKRWAYDMKTGQLLWESAPEPQFNYYGMSDNVYQGKFFSYGYGGVLLAYNITTGKIIWNWTAPSEGLGETWYTYSPLSLGAIADGKLYMYSTEHSPTVPLRRDANIWCIDAETGKLLWKISCWAAGVRIADGRLVTQNLFDNSIYCFGKGPSATTVSASPEVSVLGHKVVIKGTVTDQTPSGRHNINGGLDFTLKGTPAISDEDMESWMEYLFQQRPLPENAKGVNITLDAIDPNGNFIHIGTVTSDNTGNYGLSFTPEVPGTYQIIATFAGSKSYGPSFAKTCITVEEAPPSPTQPPEYPQPIDHTMTIIGTGIAIIIAVAIVGIWIKRK